MRDVSSSCPASWTSPRAGRHCIARAGDMMATSHPHPVVLQLRSAVRTLVCRSPPAARIRRRQDRQPDGGGPAPGAGHWTATAGDTSVASARRTGWTGSLAPETAPQTAERILRPPRPVLGRSTGRCPEPVSRRSSSTWSRSHRGQLGDRLLNPEASPARHSSRPGTSQAVRGEGTSVCNGFVPRDSRAATRRPGRSRLRDDTDPDDRTVARCSSTGPAALLRLFHSTSLSTQRVQARDSAEAATRATGSPAPAC